MKADHREQATQKAEWFRGLVAGVAHRYQPSEVKYGTYGAIFTFTDYKTKFTVHITAQPQPEERGEKS